MEKSSRKLIENWSEDIVLSQLQRARDIDGDVVQVVVDPTEEQVMHARRIELEYLDERGEWVSAGEGGWQPIDRYPDNVGWFLYLLTNLSGEPQEWRAYLIEES